MATPTAKELFIYLNSSNQLVTGAVVTVRAVGGTVTAYTYVEADAVNWPGYYYLIAPTGNYDFYINGVFQDKLSPIFHTDPELP